MVANISQDRMKQHINRSTLTAGLLKQYTRDDYNSEDTDTEQPRRGYVDLYDTPICDLCLYGLIYDLMVDTSHNYEPMTEDIGQCECNECGVEVYVWEGI